MPEYLEAVVQALRHRLGPRLLFLDLVEEGIPLFDPEGFWAKRREEI